MVHDTIINASNFNNPVELPSLRDIDRMDQLRQKAIEELKIFDNKACCQRCGTAVALGEKLITTSSQTNRIRYLKNRIEWAHRNGYDIDKCTKEELEQLTNEEQEQDLLKRLRLYSSKITRYRFFCSTCYDNAYRRSGKRKLI